MGRLPFSFTFFRHWELDIGHSEFTPLPIHSLCRSVQCKPTINNSFHHQIKKFRRLPGCLFLMKEYHIAVVSSLKGFNSASTFFYQCIVPMGQMRKTTHSKWSPVRDVTLVARMNRGNKIP